MILCQIEESWKRCGFHFITQRHIFHAYIRKVEYQLTAPTVTHERFSESAAILPN